jgi:hypothetical protein
MKECNLGATRKPLAACVKEVAKVRHVSRVSTLYFQNARCCSWNIHYLAFIQQMLFMQLSSVVDFERG